MRKSPKKSSTSESEVRIDPTGADHRLIGGHHRPVLLKEVIDHLNCRPGGTYIDCTLGEGGHALEILARIGPRGRLIGIDRDARAIAIAAQRLVAQGWVQSPGPINTNEMEFTNPAGSSALLIHANFADLRTISSARAISPADGVLFDLGASSRQFDEAGRGFSYTHDAPLDMRMDASQALTAREVVNAWSQSELTRILYEYGEERWARRIARFIVEARVRKPIETTGELTELIKAAIPAGARRRGPHPAKRTFQALRMAVNGELEAIRAGLRAAVDIVGPGGRVVAISFHSLEDREVKRAFKEAATGRFRILTRKPVTPTDDEVAENPRARSAKLRAVEAVF